MIRGLLKTIYKDVALKKEYQCSKCGKKIKIDNYEKMRKKKLSHTIIYTLAGCGVDLLCLEVIFMMPLRKFF